MKKALGKITICLCLLQSRSYADFEEWSHQASAVCPAVGDSNRILIMVPGNDSGKKSSGKFYKVDDQGKLTVLWEIDWYTDASHVFISNDIIVRIRQITLKEGGSLKQLGERPLLEFYRKGTLMKSYTVKELGDIGENFGLTGSHLVYQVFAVTQQLAPKIVTQLDMEVNTIDQYRIIEKKAIDINDIFKVDVIGGDRIFFRISSGEMLYRFKYKDIATSVFQTGK